MSQLQKHFCAHGLLNTCDLFLKFYKICLQIYNHKTFCNLNYIFHLQGGLLIGYEKKIVPIFRRQIMWENTLIDCVEL